MLMWIVKGLAELILNALNAIIGKIAELFTQSYTLDLTTLGDLFTVNGKNYLNLFFDNIICPVATALIILFLLLGLFRSLFSKNAVSDVEEPVAMIGKSAATWAGVFFFKDIMGYISNFAKIVYDGFMSIIGANPASPFADTITNNQRMMTEGANLGDDLGQLVVIVLQIVFLSAIMKMYLKLMYNYAERYVYYGLIYVFAPLGLATLGTKKTEKIGKSYFTSLISAIISLILTGAFCALFIQCVVIVNNATSPSVYILRVLMLLGFGKFILELDDYLHKIGLINQGMSAADLMSFSGLKSAFNGAKTLGAGVMGLGAAAMKLKDGGTFKEAQNAFNESFKGEAEATQSFASNMTPDAFKDAYDSGRLSDIKRAMEDASAPLLGNDDKPLTGSNQNDIYEAAFNDDGSLNLKQLSANENGDIMNNGVSYSPTGEVGRLDHEQDMDKASGEGVITDCDGNKFLATANPDGSVDVLSGNQPQHFKSVEDCENKMGAIGWQSFHGKAGIGDSGVRSMLGISENTGFKYDSNSCSKISKGADGTINFAKAENGQVTAYTGAISQYKGANSIDLHNGSYINITKADSSTQTRFASKYSADGNSIIKNTFAKKLNNNGQA